MLYMLWCLTLDVLIPMYCCLIVPHHVLIRVFDLNCYHQQLTVMIDTKTKVESCLPHGRLVCSSRSTCLPHGRLVSSSQWTHTVSCWQSSGCTAATPNPMIGSSQCSKSCKNKQSHSVMFQLLFK